MSMMSAANEFWIPPFVSSMLHTQISLVRCQVAPVVGRGYCYI